MDGAGTADEGQKRRLVAREGVRAPPPHLRDDGQLEALERVGRHVCLRRSGCGYTKPLRPVACRWILLVLRRLGDEASPVNEE